MEVVARKNFFQKTVTTLYPHKYCFAHFSSTGALLNNYFCSVTMKTNHYILNQEKSPLKTSWLCHYHPPSSGTEGSVI